MITLQEVAQLFSKTIPNKILMGVLRRWPKEDAGEHQGSVSLLRLAIVEWLLHLNLFSDAELYDILTWVERHLQELAPRLQTQDATLVSPCMCGVFDYRYVYWLDKPGCWDTAGGRVVEQMSEPALTIIMCELRVLWLRLKKRIAHLREVGHGRPATAHPDTDQPPSRPGRPEPPAATES